MLHSSRLLRNFRTLQIIVRPLRAVFLMRSQLLRAEPRSIKVLEAP